MIMDIVGHQGVTIHLVMEEGLVEEIGLTHQGASILLVMEEAQSEGQREGVNIHPVMQEAQSEGINPVGRGDLFHLLTKELKELLCS